MSKRKSFTKAARQPGYSAKGDKLYYKGDLVGKRGRGNSVTTKGVNTGRGWFMERGYGTAKKPVPDTELTRELGIANAGKGSKRMLVPAQGDVGFGVNKEESWEMRDKSSKGKSIREAEFEAPLSFAQAAKKPGYSAKNGKLYYKGDLVGRRGRGGSLTRKGVGGGRGWFMERGYGTAKKPVPDTELTRELGIANAGKGSKRMLVPAQGDVGFGVNKEESWEMRERSKRGKKIREAEEEMLGTIGEGNDFGQMGAEDWNAEQIHAFNAATKFKDAAKKPGYSAKGGKLYHKGDHVGNRDSKGNLTRKGVNTGRAWFMERGYGTAAKPVPNTELTRKIGIANAGREGASRMLVPDEGEFGFGVNAGQPWETRRLERRDRRSRMARRIRERPKVSILRGLMGKPEKIITGEMDTVVSMRDPKEDYSSRRTDMAGLTRRTAFGFGAESHSCPNCGFNAEDLY